MKRIIYYIILLVVAPFLMTNCSDDDNSTSIPSEEITPPTSQEFNELRNAALQSLTQNYTVAIESGVASFTSENGVEVYISTAFGCFTIEGEQVEGEVQIEFIELFNKANLLTTNIATMGRHTNGDLEMLVTGGAFYINVTQDGQPIDEGHCGVSMQVPTSLTGGVDYDMILWHGNFDENGNLVWDEVNAQAGQGGEMGINDDNYSFWTSQFGWTNVDRFYNDPRPKTTILVDVPEGYDNTNSSVYISYDGELGLARLDTYDSETGYFSEHYGLIPIGLECHIIFVSEYEGEWVYAIKPITIVEDDVIEILLSDLETATQTELANLIDTLS